MANNPQLKAEILSYLRYRMEESVDDGDGFVTLSIKEIAECLEYSFKETEQPTAEEIDSALAELITDSKVSRTLDGPKFFAIGLRQIWADHHAALLECKEFVESFGGFTHDPNSSPLSPNTVRANEILARFD